MKYLIAIAIGPVQDFIAAARRTADLYAGSQLLLEVTKTIAMQLEGNGAKLIFPSASSQSGANKILAEVTGDPAELVALVKTAARKYLLCEWEKALSSFSARDAVNQLRATAQIADFLEIYAAWVTLDSNHYQRSRQQVERLLAGRKALRDFAQAAQDDAGIPKSPLDASRASILKNPEDLADATANSKPLRLRKAESLDAISLLKRICGSSLKGVIDTRTMARRARNPESIPSDRDFEDEDSTSEPQPYYAILHADGDKIGAWIETKSSAKEHRDFSRILSAFSSGVQDIVKRHHGFTIYSGGDDVLAFLPVNTAIQCARELAANFAEKLPKASLSVGVAIVHYREPLSISLEYARAAEKTAKNKSDPNKNHHGNRLAVALHTRGGAPMTVVEPWKTSGDRLELEALLELYEAEQFSRGVPYELKQLAREWVPDLPASALQAEFLRIIKRKQATKDTALKLDHTHWLELSVSQATDSRAAITALERFAKKLVLARFLSGLGTAQ
jgi:CRISPR-associated protein Cmr2